MIPLLALWLGCSCGSSLANGPGTLVCEVNAPDLSESSGLVRSSTDGVFWTHNDSGGDPSITAFDTTGAVLGTVAIQGATAIDWEEIAAFDLKDRRFLLIADTGDNDRVRPEATLYLVAEPDPLAGTARPLRTLRFRYPDGPHDCEAMAVDPVSQTILLITKDRDDGTTAYSLPLGPTQAQVLTATPLTTLELAPPDDLSGRRVTAMDLSSDGTRLAVLTYTHAWEWERPPRASWPEVFAGPKRKIELPPLKQREGMAYGPDDRTLFFTSEGVPMPLVSIP